MFPITRATGFARTKGEAEYPHLWPTAGAWSPCLSSPGGSTLFDGSGRGNHGTLTTMDPATDWVTIGGYQSLDFDGVNDYVDCGTVRVPFTGSYTASVWAYPRSWADLTNPFQRGNTFYVGRHSSFTSSAGGFSVRDTNSGVGYFGWQAANFVAAPPLNSWNHMVGVVRSGISFSCYLNGVFQSTTNMSTGQYDATHSVVIGGNGSQAFDGYVTDALIHYNITLTAGEIAELYRLGPGGWATPRRRRVYASEQVAAPATSFYVIGGGCASASGVI